MQAFICDWVRARTKLGIAIAARRPIMATTIMISTSVKPDFLDVLIVILTLPFCFWRCELHNRRVFLITVFVYKIPAGTAELLFGEPMAKMGHDSPPWAESYKKGLGWVPGPCLMIFRVKCSAFRLVRVI